MHRQPPLARMFLMLTALAALAAAGCASDEPTRGRRGVGKADHLSGTCVDSCGGQAEDGTCYCDDQCEGFGDCCEDYEPVCTSPQGQMCGGFAGFTCDDGEFCAFPLDATCGFADASGTCQAIPEVCIEVYAPVCGCDGNTYDNECFANAAGTAIIATGECDDNPGPNPDPDPEPKTSCSGACGGASADGCYCDDLCVGYGDCCDDYQDVCEGRTPASGVCVRNSGDECSTDAECMVGGCGGEVCFNPDESSGVSTCDCGAPTGPTGCGCVDGSCTWFN